MSVNTELQKWTFAVVCGTIFLLVSAPFTYYATNYVTTKINSHLTTADDDGNGRPTLGGLLLHMVVFILLVRLSMLIPYEQFLPA